MLHPRSRRRGGLRLASRSTSRWRDDGLALGLGSGGRIRDARPVGQPLLDLVLAPGDRVLADLHGRRETAVANAARDRGAARTTALPDLAKAEQATLFFLHAVPRSV